MAIKPIEIEELESKAGNIYEAIIIAAKRARQINDEEKLEFNERVQPLLETEQEEESTFSKDKMEISLDFENRKKQVERGIDDLMNDQLDFRLRTEDDK